MSDLFYEEKLAESKAMANAFAALAVAATVTGEPIPAYLLRNKDNTLADPKPWGPVRVLPPAPIAPPTKEDVTRLSDDQLWDRLSMNISVADRQPLFREHARRTKKKRDAQRIAEMKARMADANGSN